jgi:hypothetical protein
MLNKEEARIFLKKLVEKYSVGDSEEKDNLLKVIENKSRPIPIRGAMEHLKGVAPESYTDEELMFIDELLYKYG